MGRCRFVSQDTVQIKLADVYRRQLTDPEKQKPKASKKQIADAKQDLADAEADGAWIVVKGQLNAGEAKLALKASYGTAGRFGLVEAGFAKLVAYIVDWSLTDAQGEAIPVSPDAIDGVDTETYQELIAAVEWHDQDVARVRDEEKKTRRSGPPSSATSESLGGRDGRSSMSAH